MIAACDRQTVLLAAAMGQSVVGGTERKRQAGVRRERPSSVRREGGKDHDPLHLPALRRSDEHGVRHDERRLVGQELADTYLVLPRELRADAQRGTGSAE